MHSKVLLRLALVAFFLIPSLAIRAQQTQPAGRIEARRVVGQVTARENSANAATVTVTDGMALTEGMIVTTAPSASVVLVFSNGATLSLGEDSVLDIQQFTQSPFSQAFAPSTATAEPSTSTTKIMLTRGELVGKVATLNTAGGSEFTVSTPVGAAGIRGTTFRIVYRPNGNGQAFFSVSTLEGNVEVTLATGTVNAPSVFVTDNEQVVLTNVILNVDANGNVSIQVPAGFTFVATIMPPTTSQDILATVQEIAQAVADIVIPTTGPITTGNPPPPPTPSNEEPPGPTTRNDQTTPGDGLQSR